MNLNLVKEYNPALRLLALPLVAMAWAGPIRTVRSAYLPPSSISFGDCKTVIGVTPADPPLFMDFSEAALEHGSDVVLIRAGLSPEVDNPVTVDIAIRTPAEVITFDGYHFVERANGALWICAERSEGPAMEVSSRGLGLHIRQPFGEEERADGACRAAAQIVRLSRGTI
ncbi:hypothetical protein A9995_07030 [Erythrobacter sp. QSSC1-22B]|uniref:hypothetical protein n=1 Tax=Erythrobacter sp. QSSC1-22B TaxID=1860125 RepID=UPI0008053667|nr:hypothetical protein [Erythrobacter sp. QSSC1-22B]OBX19497.1 hypothetical protein A9995_07030 [Erythrobacter sp. QSSC1-22B]